MIRRVIPQSDLPPLMQELIKMERARGQAQTPDGIETSPLMSCWATYT